MARRRRGQEEYQGPGAVGRPPRKRGGNEGLWLALGGAAVVGLVFFLIVSGGSSGSAEKQEAAVVFERFLKSLIGKNESMVMRDVYLEGILIEYGPEVRKKWRSMSPEDKKRTRWEVYKWLLHKSESQLRLETIGQARRKIIDKSEVSWDSYRDWVQFRWVTEGYKTIIAERHHTVSPEAWLARLSNASGTWKVVKFGPETQR